MSHVLWACLDAPDGVLPRFEAMADVPTEVGKIGDTTFLRNERKLSI